MTATRKPQRRRGKDTDPRSDEWLTIDEVCRIVKIGRRTFERYMSLGTGPRVKRIAGNGPIRIRRDWLDEWMEEGAA
ncbi:MAG: helix-turn-helix transcriptional regulator [Streptosporangiaceae bacterium]